MKAWFIFNVNGERVGVWTNSSEDGEKLLRTVYGNESAIDFIDLDWFGDVRYRKLDVGMSSVDMMIASGTIGYLLRPFRSL